MLFNSYVFVFLFLPISLLGFFQLARVNQTYASAWLALSSLFFYGYWNPAYVGLLLLSIGSNYVLGMLLTKVNLRRKLLLISAVTANILLLGYFKYANFFLGSLDALTGSNLRMTSIILPLGISFFTFTQIAFLVDTYQNKVREFNFLHYVLFVTYFPHLIAGPVLHHKDMMPQFAHAVTYRINWQNVANGLLLFTLGLCKKTLGADELAPFATAIFNGVQYGMASGLVPTIYEAWSGALAYTLQIYFDFSGYTDMALGIALIFNIRLPINFNSPYKSTSIIEFWRRWHITLSIFLRDYLYIPLGGNRHGKLRRYVNLFATMLLGGLWHGAGWTFVVWGALHGFYLTVNHLWRELIAEKYLRWIPNWLGALTGGALTFIAVVAAWVVFRADNITQASAMLQAMFGLHYKAISFDTVMHGQLLLTTDLSGRDLIKTVILALLWVWLLPNSTKLKFYGGNLFLTLCQVVVVVYLLCVAIDHFGFYSPFLYFQF